VDDYLASKWRVGEVAARHGFLDSLEGFVGVAQIPESPLLLRQNDEKRLIGGTVWREGNAAPGQLTRLFPSFQPTPAGKQKPAGSKVSGKPQVIFGPFRSLTNANSGAAQLTFQKSRPLSFADAIVYAAKRNVAYVAALKYGPVVAPVESDHFPVIGMFVVYV